MAANLEPMSEWRIAETARGNALWHRVRDHPEDYEANRDFGLFCARHEALADQAEPYLAKALSLRAAGPDTVEILVQLADLYRRAGDFDKAATTYAVQRSLAPGDLVCAMRLGDAKNHLGRIDEASALFRELLDVLAARARDLAARLGEPVRRLIAPSGRTHGALGELSFGLDVFLKARALGWIDDFEVLFIAPEGDAMNRCLLDYWREHLRIIEDPAEAQECRRRYGTSVFPLDYIPVDGGRVLVRELAYALVRKRWAEEKRPPLLRISPDHAARGRARLRELGVPNDAWFAVLHVREATYYESQGFKRELLNDLRNGRVEDYGPAIRAITGRGGWVIRMGDASATPLPPMPRAIDYAHSQARSDWMDIFLIGASRLLVGTNSGPAMAAIAFGTPFIGCARPLTSWAFRSPKCCARPSTRPSARASTGFEDSRSSTTRLTRSPTPSPRCWIDSTEPSSKPPTTNAFRPPSAARPIPTASASRRGPAPISCGATRNWSTTTRNQATRRFLSKARRLSSDSREWR